jgi:ATP-dependent DNA ligase
VAFVAFDVLRIGDDVRHLALSHRRERLQRVVDGVGDTSLQLMTQTTDCEAAELWLDASVSITGVEGVVCKLDEAYPKPDARRWRKVRRMSTMELLVCGFVPESVDSMRLVLASGDGHPVGTTYPVSVVDMTPLQPFLRDASPAAHRIWAPFEDGRRDWFQLPAGHAPSRRLW